MPARRCAAPASGALRRGAGGLPALLLALAAAGAAADRGVYVEKEDETVAALVRVAHRAEYRGNWLEAINTYERIRTHEPHRLLPDPYTPAPALLARYLEIFRRIDAGRIRIDPNRRYVPEIFLEFGEVVTPAEALRLHDLHRREGIDAVVRHLENRRATFYVSARRYATARLAAMAPEGRAVYARLFDARARLAFETAAAAGNVAGLEKLAADHPVTPWAARALDLLATLALEGGRSAQALDHWRRLDELGTAAAAGLAESELIARMAFAASLAGEPGWIARLARRVRRRSVTPDPIVRVGSRRVHLVPFLEESTRRAGERACRPPVTSWPTAGGNPARSGVMADFERVGPLLWQFEWGRHVKLHASRNPGPLEQSLPVVDGGRLYVASALSVVAIDLGAAPSRGEPKVAWTLTWKDDSPRRASPLEYPRAVTAHRGRVLAVFDNLAVKADRPGFADSSLVALDRDGRILWVRPAVPEEQESETLLKGALIAGPPLAIGDRVYAGVTTLVTQPESYVYCFDLATGKTLWKRFICNADSLGRLGGRAVAPAALSAHGNRLFFCSNLGAFCALDRTSGEILWLHVYPPRRTLQHSRHIRRLLPTGRPWYPNPPVVSAGRVHFSPADAHSLFVVDTHSGRIHFRYPPGFENTDHRFVAAAPDGALVLAGRDLLLLDDGTDRTRLDRWRTPALGQILGLPSVARTGVFVSARHGGRSALWRMQMAGGRAVPASVGSLGNVLCLWTYRPYRCRCGAAHDLYQAAPTLVCKCGRTHRPDRKISLQRTVVSVQGAWIRAQAAHAAR